MFVCCDREFPIPVPVPDPCLCGLTEGTEEEEEEDSGSLVWEEEVEGEVVLVASAAPNIFNSFMDMVNVSTEQINKK